MIQCPKCGSAVSPEDLFCTVCGQRMAPQPEPGYDPLTEPFQTPPQSFGQAPVPPFDPAAEPVSPADPWVEPANPADPWVEPANPADPWVEPANPADSWVEPANPADPWAAPEAPPPEEPQPEEKSPESPKGPANKPAFFTILAVALLVVILLSVLMVRTTLNTLQEYEEARQNQLSNNPDDQPAQEQHLYAYVTGVDADGLDIRSEIGENGGEVIAQLPAGTKVEIVDCNESAFSYIYYELGNLHGYAKNWNLTDDPLTACETAFFFTREDGTPFYEQSDSTEADTVLIGGKRVQLIAKTTENRWLMLVDGEYGYLDPAALAPEQPVRETIIGEGPAPYEPYENYYVMNVTSYLALRNAPAHSVANEIGPMYKGELVQVLDKTGDYWYVYSPKLEMYGYANSKYLKP